MLFRQIRYFIAVVETKSFTEAAEQCYISQSAISRQIAALEAELGVPLMKRENRKFSLTPAGEYFYREGKIISERIESLKAETIRLADKELTLRVGYCNGYEGRALQDTISEFTALYPEVVLTIGKYSHEDLFRKITSDELDLVLSYQRRAFSDAFVNFHIKYLALYAEISERNHYAEKTFLTSAELAQMVCILVTKPEQRNSERDFHRRVLGFGENYCFAENTDDAHLMVLANRGFFPTVETVPPNGVRQLPVFRDGKQLELNFCAFWLKNRTNYYIEEFTELFRKKFTREP